MKGATKNHRFYTILAIGWGIVIFLYCALRAWKVSFTHDEAYSLSRYVHGIFWKVITYKDSDPNNHMMNSVMMKLMSLITGDHWFSLRLPSLIALACFLLFLYKILITNVKGLLVPLGMVLCTFNPYFLDFFCLARGYAGANALIMLCLYLANRHIYSQGKESKALPIAVLTSGIAVLFHLSILNFFVPFVLLMLLFPFIRQWMETGRLQFKALISLTGQNMAGALILFAIFLLYILPVVFHFKTNGEFDFAGQRSFWDNTVGTLLWNSFYFQPYAYIGWVVAAVKGFILFIFFAAVALIGLSGIFKLQAGFPFFILLLLLSMMAFFIAQHYILHNPYPIERFVTYLFPLFMLLAVFVFDRLISYDKFFYALPAAFSLIAVFHLVRSTNLDHVENWAYDACDAKMLADLEQIVSKDSGIQQPAELGAEWFYEPSVNYYRHIRHLDWLRNMHREGVNPRQKYLYLDESALSDYPSWQLKILKKYPLCHTVLAEHTNADTSSPFFSDEDRLDAGEQNLRVEIPAKALPQGDSILLEIEATAVPHKVSDRISLATSRAENGQTVFWKDEVTDYYSIDCDKGQTYSFSYKLPPSQDPNSSISIFTREEEGVKTAFTDLKVKAYLLKHQP